jgi:transcriptional regulator with PAS, ATPase and Fis domain
VLLARLARGIADAPARELISKVTEAAYDPHGVIGTHPLVESLRSFIRKVAAVPQVSVLLLGESGTGKSMVARAIHGAGAGSRQRFVEINCAALPAHLLEAELFGYEKGAFTDARQTKKGLVEVADGGTLFLDEVGTIGPEIQAKLLSFLESRSFRRLGSTREASVNVRIIAATNVDLESEVMDGTFREDLFYRLNVASYTLPPLRHIRSDIPVLARHFVGRAASYFGKPVPELDRDGLERLQAYAWPGNARELRNVIERSMIFSQGRTLEIVELPTAGTSGPTAATRSRSRWVSRWRTWSGATSRQRFVPPTATSTRPRRSSASPGRCSGNVASSTGCWATRFAWKPTAPPDQPSSRDVSQPGSGRAIRIVGACTGAPSARGSTSTDTAPASCAAPSASRELCATLSR